MSDTDYSQKKIDGFEGPFINQYLPSMAIGPGEKKFADLEDAIEAALKMKNCSGITLSRQGKFTLRFQRKLKDSDTKNRFKNKEISWMKNQNSQPNQIEKINEVVKDLYSISKKTKGDKAIKEEIYEIIKYKQRQYYYNCINNQAYDLDTMNLYKFRRGKLIFIE
jgi:hypothetical protein